MDWGFRLNYKKKANWVPAFIPLCFLAVEAMDQLPSLVHHDGLSPGCVKHSLSLSCLCQAFGHSNEKIHSHIKQSTVKLLKAPLPFLLS